MTNKTQLHSYNLNRRYGTKCSGCDEGILPTNLVRRAKGMVFHVQCFHCSVCMKEITTGDKLYHVGGTKFVCEEDYDVQIQEIESMYYVFCVCTRIYRPACLVKVSLYFLHKIDYV